ncbi:DUF732 domain-containing protein [Mycolicibacterium tusciae]|uniref:DUF732 domain-containing protein n=1 Tax=Mycolicibacterium tusciae TaxID=75922 RepID=UPI00024A31C2|nr:DUF732 domain-containing protein [Mycolicibacterium tusciae]
MIRSTGMVSALVAAAVLSAPSAAADETEYLNKLQDRYEFLTPQQLLAEGQRVCAAERSGVLSPAKTMMVMNDLSVGTNTALEIVSAAEWNLC